jgi:hypothetical protein
LSVLGFLLVFAVGCTSGDPKPNYSSFVPGIGEPVAVIDHCAGGSDTARTTEDLGSSWRTYDGEVPGAR